MSDEKCVTAEEMEKMLRSAINGGIKRGNRSDWVKISALCVSVLVVSVGAMRYILQSEIRTAATNVEQKIELHETLPWHDMAGQAHAETSRHLADIDEKLTRQTTILERVERSIERN